MMRYSSQNNYLKLNKKRKSDGEIDSSSGLQKNSIYIQDTSLGKGYSPSLKKKQRFPIPISVPSNFSEKSPILIKNLKKVKTSPDNGYYGRQIPVGLMHSLRSWYFMFLTIIILILIISILKKI